MRICETPKTGPTSYPTMIRHKDDMTLRHILSGDRYKHSKRPDFRYWYRLAFAEGKKRGLI
jgi:hypothetical protein